MISTKYAPQEIEDKWYKYWLENKFFASKPNPDKEPYTIVIPPPNVTGVLHMGHMLNNTIQDVLIRKARMEGKEACWVPGTDHASIATEAKVVAMLKEKGIEKKDISREEFLKYAMEWKDKYGGIILEQLKKLGASCDWDRTNFTMDEHYYESVIDVFVDLYNKGHIYRGVRMVNWDPQGLTAVSDEEVIEKEVVAKLYYLTYPLSDGSGEVTIATTRPETIMADTAVCVNPNDPRFEFAHGKTVKIPLLGREIPIILDDYVTMDFGTGALKVTPAHDLNDYELGIKHKLPIIDILNDEGFLNEKAVLYIGQDRFAARRNIVKDLEEAGHLVKMEEYKSIVKTSERTGAVIEPKLSLQWFMKMKEISKPAYENVMNDEIRLFPPKFKNMYASWMENVRDWCISRQLWWGHQIPAFYLKDGTIIVAKNKREALRKAQHELLMFALCEEDITQDPDVLDTWASSWLWPIATFDGIRKPDNEEINYYYPTNDLVTAPEILFFWVARMIIAGYEYRGEMPFKNVYLTGIVRDKLGRKMSKSLGNSPDPLDLIADHGADAVRTGMLFSSPAGNDLMYDIKLVEQGRNFCNKIWNAYRLVDNWKSPLTPTGGTAPSNDVKSPLTPDGGTSLPKDDGYWEKADTIIYGLLKDYSKKRRNNPTKTEDIIWGFLSGKKLEKYKFRRQHIIGHYITDFVCIKQRLIIEIDGLLHQLPENIESDEARTNWLHGKGYKVIRLTNNEVISDLDSVLSRILNALQSTPPVGRSDESAGGLCIAWFNSKLNQTINEVQDNFAKFRISDALLSIYNLIWDDFCGKYLEMIKPPFEQPIDRETYEATIEIFDKLMRLAHPYMPFITEEIWQEIVERADKETIVKADFPKAGNVDEKVLADFEILFAIVSKIREVRNTKQISPKVELPLAIITTEPTRYEQIESIIIKLANVEKIEFVSEKQEKAISFVVKADEFFIKLEQEIDSAEALEQAKKDLEYYQGFKKSVEAKLSNERFVTNAKPEIIEKERQKLADAEVKIKALVGVVGV